MLLKQLKTFLVVYEEGSFGKAATRLASTQPGLSVQVSALESELKVKLFHRHPRGVEPTPEGKQLYARGLRLLHDANSVKQEMVALSGNVTGTVSAGISPALGRAVLAPVLARFVQEFPNVELRVSEDYSSTLLSLVEARAVDFAILMHVPNHPTIRFEHFYKDQFVAVSSTRDLPKKPSPISLNTPPYHKLVVPSVHHGLQSALDVSFRTGRVVAERLIEVNSLSGVLEFVASSDWIALVPYTAVHFGLDKSRVGIRAIAGSQIPIDYYIAHAPTDPLSAAAKAFSDITREELSKIRNTAASFIGDDDVGRFPKSSKKIARRPATKVTAASR